MEFYVAKKRLQADSLLMPNFGQSVPFLLSALYQVPGIGKPNNATHALYAILRRFDSYVNLNTVSERKTPFGVFSVRLITFIP